MGEFMKQTDYVILGLLSEAPMTGYDIKRTIDTRFGFFWNESYGQLYPTLKALHEAGYISEQTPAAISTRGKRTYALLPAGMEALRAWLEKPVEKESVRLEILLKMYFSHLICARMMLAHVTRFKEEHAQDLRSLEAFEQELRATRNDDPAYPVMLRVVDFGIRANKAYLDWCEETGSYLESSAGKTPV